MSEDKHKKSSLQDRLNDFQISPPAEVEQRLMISLWWKKLISLPILLSLLSVATACSILIYINDNDSQEITDFKSQSSIENTYSISESNIQKTTIDIKKYQNKSITRNNVVSKTKNGSMKVEGKVLNLDSNLPDSKPIINTKSAAQTQKILSESGSKTQKATNKEITNNLARENSNNEQSAILFENTEETSKKSFTIKVPSDSFLASKKFINNSILSQSTISEFIPKQEQQIDYSHISYDGKNLSEINLEVLSPLNASGFEYQPLAIKSNRYFSISALAGISDITSENLTSASSYSFGFETSLNNKYFSIGTGLSLKETFGVFSSSQNLDSTSLSSYTDFNVNSYQTERIDTLGIDTSNQLILDTVVEITNDTNYFEVQDSNTINYTNISKSSLRFRYLTVPIFIHKKFQFNQHNINIYAGMEVNLLQNFTNKTSIESYSFSHAPPSIYLNYSFSIGYGYNISRKFSVFSRFNFAYAKSGYFKNIRYISTGVNIGLTYSFLK